MALVRVTRWLSIVAIGATALTGCGGSGTSDSGAHAGAITVVASTDVWGSVVHAVAGDHATVKSILSGGTVDPHTYQATPSDAAALGEASLVVYNGGGYDGWVEDVLARNSKIKPIDAFSFLPNAGDEHAPNEHVFYNVAVAKSVATAVGDRLATIDPANAADYRANAVAFGRGADAIADTERSIDTTFAHTSVVSTEPVAFYLLQATGLADRTPAAFSKANENGTDPSPADMAFVLDLIDQRRVAAVLINPQTSTPAINNLRDSAKRAGVGVTNVAETLTAGTDYLTWQRNTVNGLLDALRSSQGNVRH
ncbi:metal ABC transporter solute-binding protein, Zn/Mn family [Mycobacterium shigaense]|uniref:ABC transporter substrate-binding protein n=1 Tax=Mycobacterium shigaense TaxID=722731 RepID=A0A1Z4ENV6_9MYCO|nr:zinc ABC transporter substrate-binding protein [Mycobacterium shigaense]MEA1122709.1 zinc ABC transporter substrate-binding protein [Mycobacterium shigaense]PRI14888.1 ABC transporter substrate-binding protein [Mycobacterium shigaense]BAX94684.1 ABC transporter substrate-binding protein [Mycobacterium shigaense]